MPAEHCPHCGADLTYLATLCTACGRELAGPPPGSSPMTALLTPVMVLAAIGFVVSLASHVCALVGLPQPLGDRAFILHIGIFVVWLPAVIVGNKLARDYKQEEFWEAALRGCPRWMTLTAKIFFVYAIINFALFVLSGSTGRHQHGAGMPPEVVRGFSGHWMVFYSAAFCILYSAIQVAKRDPARRCPNGHPVPPSAKFCEQCGGEIAGGAAGPG
jgi:hypothetical protein